MKKTLKNMLQSKRMTRIVGAYDALSGLLVQQAGFDAIWGSGFCVSASHGLPDANIIGCDTVIKSYADIARATDIPVIADCDTGYGNFHNVIYATRELERHNIKGICIEDKVYPKINSLFPGVTHMLDSPENFVNKIKAAADARKNSDFCIIARTEALVAGFNIDEVLYRADLYRCAGADAIIIHSRESDVGKILKVFEIWDGRLPLIAIPT
ncbi:MAG TPA: isocitrate lyase/phosphoenolpyruvate mutase family protein, partial [Clostridia bacterium]|nr:isocitrate lyase/phosphoenolpyruvate mutase family protein [Clostridia bacterium]